jgi:hypothetical protein
MARPKQQSKTSDDPVVAKLVDGTYDRQIAEFEAQIEAAAAMLRRAYEAMRAENTLRS